MTVEWMTRRLLWQPIHTHCHCFPGFWEEKCLRILSEVIKGNINTNRVLWGYWKMSDRPPKVGSGPGEKIVFAPPPFPPARADRLKIFTLNRKDWLSGVNLYSRQTMILPRKIKTYVTYGPSNLHGFLPTPDVRDVNDFHLGSYRNLLGKSNECDIQRTVHRDILL
jgi:hypothetical protein